MKARIVISLVAALAIPGAHAAQKKPGPEDGSVTCQCRCSFTAQDGTKVSAVKDIRGQGNWNGTRSECQAFNGSSCVAEYNGARYGSDLERCDTIVHSRPGRMQSPAKAPSNDKLAPGN